MQFSLLNTFCHHFLFSFFLASIIMIIEANRAAATEAFIRANQRLDEFLGSNLADAKLDFDSQFVFFFFFCQAGSKRFHFVGGTGFYFDGGLDDEIDLFLFY